MTGFEKKRGKTLLVLVPVLLIGSAIGAALLIFGQGEAPVVRDSAEPEAVNPPPQRFPGAPRESVKAQDFSKVDFKNPHTVRNAPRMMTSLTRLEKLVLIGKLKETETTAAAQALENIVLNPIGKCSPEEDIRAHAIGALVAMNTQEAWSVVLRLSQSEDAQIRAWVGTSLGYSKSSEADQVLSVLTRDESELVVKQAEESVFVRKAEKAK